MATPKTGMMVKTMLSRMRRNPAEIPLFVAISGTMLSAFSFFVWRNVTDREIRWTRKREQVPFEWPTHIDQYRYLVTPDNVILEKIPAFGHLEPDQAQTIINE